MRGRGTKRQNTRGAMRTEARDAEDGISLPKPVCTSGRRRGKGEGDGAHSLFSRERGAPGAFNTGRHSTVALSDPIAAASLRHVPA